MGVSTLVLVWLGKFVGVTEYNLPLAVLSPVGLGAAKRPRLLAITDVSGHVLQIDCEGKIVADGGDDVLCAPVSRSDAFRRPVEPGAHLFPATFMTPKCAHDHDVRHADELPEPDEHQGRHPNPVGSS